jgi:hypothetical protein
MAALLHLRLDERRPHPRAAGVDLHHERAIDLGAHVEKADGVVWPAARRHVGGRGRPTAAGIGGVGTAVETARRGEKYLGGNGAACEEDSDVAHYFASGIYSMRGHFFCVCAAKGIAHALFSHIRWSTHDALPRPKEQLFFKGGNAFYSHCCRCS